ncbi:uncharacterized protein LOC139931527 isoform X1 [Centroberyx gerrardi]
METSDFVRDKLREWGLSEWIHRFEDEGIDKESFLILDDSDIKDVIPKVGPRAKFKKRLKELLQAQQIQIQPSCHPVTPDPMNRSGLKEELGPSTSNFSTLRVTDEGEMHEVNILAEVKEIMKRVHDKLDEQGNTKLNDFLKDKLNDLETGKKQLVGVFGKTGAGKSSLINAIIGKKDLLPSGDVSACTSVMIKVEANMSNSKYMAEIEFITKQEWKDELCSISNVIKENEDGDDDDDFEKLSALYGTDNRKSPEELMGNKYFIEIPEFLKCRKKILTCESSSELSEKLAKYTRGDKKESGRQYWPLVKCVTIKVPNVTDLLEHVTLVDLPGSGDCNKSRDEMWKEIVGSCSTVWIVTDTNRAASEKEPWEILDDTISLMGNGGECRSISFICTKSDAFEDSDEISKDKGRAYILNRNEQAKKQVREKFNRQNKIKKHFSGDSDLLQVFTVSSREFQKEREKFLQKDETEIPNLQKFLQNLNDRQSKTSNYVSGAYGILSLIQGANRSKMACHKPEVCTVLEQRIKDELDKVRQSMDEAYKVFENCLSEGVKKSQESCENNMKFILAPKGKQDRGFYSTLKSLVENDGIYKPKDKKKRGININEKLTSCMRDHIDEEFKKTFPNEGRCGPFKGVINKFTLDTDSLVDKYKDVSLQLIFLKTEEAKLKTNLNDYIREKKKQIYGRLTNSIKDSMQPCYEKAATYSGKDMLKNMRDTIEKHLKDSKNTMFNKAKDEMLDQMRKLMKYILKTLDQNMKRSIELSLKTDDNSIPDVTEEYQRGKKCYDKLGNPNKETPMTCVEPLKPKAASDFQPMAHAQSHVSGVTVLSPHILHETDDHKPSYRLDCPGPGLFQCASTGLVFEMEKKGEVFYRTVDWDNLLSTLTPAGPLFSIQCPQCCVHQLHLPHCEILSDDPDKLLVAHVIDGKMEEVQPNRMTTTHVIVDVTTLSLYGLFRRWFSRRPVQGQVLLFQRTAANQSCTLNVLLLPRNVPICEVESHQRGCTFIQTSSNCTLSPKGGYGLGCETVAETGAEIQPQSGMFDCDYSPNYHPTFQVFLESGAETVRLILMDRRNNDQRVWESLVPLAAASGFEEPQLTPTLGATEFFQRYSSDLIQRVSEVMAIADDLRAEHVITQEMYARISNIKPSQEQMRELLTVVRAAGSAAMSAFYKALKQNQPGLIEDLVAAPCSHR